MDPLTLLAAVKTATAAVKKGCELYQEYKAEGVELVDALGEAKDVVQEIGSHLRTFFGAHEKLEKHLEEEAVKATKVRDAGLSINEEAFNRIMAQKELNRVEQELRETMVYHAPPELGAIWSEFEKMRDRIREERAEARRQEQYRQQVAEWRRRRVVEDLKEKAAWIGAVLFVVVWTVYLMVLIRTSHTYRGHFSSCSWWSVFCLSL